MHMHMLMATVADTRAIPAAAHCRGIGASAPIFTVYVGGWPWYREGWRLMAPDPSCWDSWRACWCSCRSCCARCMLAPLLAWLTPALLLPLIVLLVVLLLALLRPRLLLLAVPEGPSFPDSRDRPLPWRQSRLWSSMRLKGLRAAAAAGPPPGLVLE